MKNLLKKLTKKIWAEELQKQKELLLYAIDEKTKLEKTVEEQKTELEAKDKLINELHVTEEQQYAKLKELNQKSGEIESERNELLLRVSEAREINNSLAGEINILKGKLKLALGLYLKRKKANREDEIAFKQAYLDLGGEL